MKLVGIVEGSREILLHLHSTNLESVFVDNREGSKLLKFKVIQSLFTKVRGLSGVTKIDKFRRIPLSKIFMWRVTGKEN